MIVHCAGVAQSAERILGKDKVTSSILVISSISGGIAQLARACGSYPQCPEFKSLCRHHIEFLTASLCGKLFFVGGVRDMHHFFHSAGKKTKSSLDT